MKRFLSVLAPVALYGLSNEAHAALSCKDIVELHSYGTKSDVIIQMMRDKGFENEELACLKKKNAPQDIVVL